MLSLARTLTRLYLQKKALELFCRIYSEMKKVSHRDSPVIARSSMSGEKEIKTEALSGPQENFALSFDVLASETGDRLDHAVAARYPELSRTRVKELIEGQLVLVDGKPSKGSHRLHIGEKVAVNPKARPPLRAHAESIPLDILRSEERRVGKE